MCIRDRWSETASMCLASSNEGADAFADATRLPAQVARFVAYSSRSVSSMSMSFHNPGAIFGASKVNVGVFSCAVTVPIATSIVPAITCHALVITVKASKHPSAWQVANPESIPTNKATLRTRMRKVLREHTHDSTVREAISRWLVAHPEIRTISAFAALPGEPDLLPLLAEFPDRQWIFPRIENERLILHPVADPSSDLLPGAFGIREPSPALPVIDATEIDAFLCPGLAFDQQGGRLGRGRGFYDRLLARARPRALKLGIAFPFQLVADTFPEPHDIRMNEVLAGEES